MRYLPMLAAMAGLLVLVIFMAPDQRRGEVARNMAVTIGVLVVLVFLFGLVAKQWVEP